MKKQVEEKKLQKEDVKLEEAFVLWKNEAKSGINYLKGNTPIDKKGNQLSLVGFFHTNKANPKEPDIRVYSLNDGEQDKEVCALWENISKNETRHLTGMTDEREKIIAFYNDSENEKRPYIRAYYKQD